MTKKTIHTILKEHKEWLQSLGTAGKQGDLSAFSLKNIDLNKHDIKDIKGLKTFEQVRRYLGVSKALLYSWVNSKDIDIPLNKIDQRYYFTDFDINSFISKNGLLFKRLFKSPHRDEKQFSMDCINFSVTLKLKANLIKRLKKHSLTISQFLNYIARHILSGEHVFLTIGELASRLQQFNLEKGVLHPKISRINFRLNSQLKIDLRNKLKDNDMSLSQYLEFMVIVYTTLDVNWFDDKIRYFSGFYKP